MSGHRRLAPSASKYWMQCPRRPDMEIEAVRRGFIDEGSTAAREGTFFHAVAELMITRRLGPDAAVRLLAIQGDPGCHFYNDEMKRHLYWSVGAVWGWIKSMDFRLEMSSSLSELTKRPADDLGGSGDVVAWDKKALHVFDYKYGLAPVKVEHNTQLLIYGLGSLYQLIKEGVCSPRHSLHLHIIQPRLSHQVKSWTPRKGDLVHFIQDLTVAARRTDDPNAPFVVGECCHFCNAKTICPGRRQQVVDLINDSLFDDALFA